jgi:hypothetical protein
VVVLRTVTAEALTAIVLQIVGGRADDPLVEDEGLREVVLRMTTPQAVMMMTRATVTRGGI